MGIIDPAGSGAIKKNVQFGPDHVRDPNIFLSEQVIKHFFNDNVRFDEDSTHLKFDKFLPIFVLNNL